MKDSTKIVIAGIGILGAAGVAAYAVSQLTGPVGGSCSTPGTPCYAALQPYQAEFQNCANTYAQDLKAFNAEDAKNGTGFTAGQLSELNYLTGCMNAASANIAKVAHQYAPTNAIAILSGAVGAAVLAAGIGVGAGVFVKALRTRPINGGSAADALNNAVTRLDVQDGTITAEQASDLSSQLASQNSVDISDVSDYLNGLVEADIIDAETADALFSTLSDAMTADTDATVEELGAL